MDQLERIAAWISENEALFSGMAAIVALAAIVPALIRSVLRTRRKARQEPGARAVEPATGALPRLAVLPVEAPGDRPELLTTAELLTEDLTQLLARSGGAEVLSLRSSRGFASSGGSLSEARSTLGVRYVVEASIRDTADGPRVSATLSDTHRDKLIWSDSFSASEPHASDASQQMAQHIAAHLGVEVVRAEVDLSKRRRHNRAARDFVLQSQGVLFEEGHHRESYAKAIALLEKAIAKDPEDAPAHGHLALLLALGSVFGFLDAGAEDRATHIIRRALELDDRSSEVLGAAGCAYCDLHQYDQGIPLLERAVALNPSNAQARAALGTGLLGVRRVEEGIEALQEALRITPAYKGIAPWATVLAGGYLRLGQLAEARDSISTALRCDPSFYPAQLSAALICLAEGDEEGIDEHVREALQLNPHLDTSTLTRLLSSRGADLLAGRLERIRAA